MPISIKFKRLRNGCYTSKNKKIYWIKIESGAHRFKFRKEPFKINVKSQLKKY